MSGLMTYLKAAVSKRGFYNPAKAAEAQRASMGLFGKPWKVFHTEVDSTATSIRMTVKFGGDPVAVRSFTFGMCHPSIALVQTLQKGETVWFGSMTIAHEGLNVSKVESYLVVMREQPAGPPDL